MTNKESISLGGAGRAVDGQPSKYVVDDFSIIRTLSGCQAQSRHCDEAITLDDMASRRTRSFSLRYPIGGTRTITFFPIDADASDGVQVQPSSGDVMVFTITKAIHRGDEFIHGKSADALHWYGHR